MAGSRPTLADWSRTHSHLPRGPFRNGRNWQSNGRTELLLHCHRKVPQTSHEASATAPPFVLRNSCTSVAEGVQWVLLRRGVSGGNQPGDPSRQTLGKTWACVKVGAFNEHHRDLTTQRHCSACFVLSGLRDGISLPGPAIRRSRPDRQLELLSIPGDPALAPLCAVPLL